MLLASGARTLQFVLRALAGSAAVLGAVYIALRLNLNFAATGFLDLFIVVLVAMIAGFWEATVTSLLALICLNYFFVPPIYTFFVADPQNWVALFAFESAALVVSRLSSQMEQQARRAILERSRMEKLYDLSRRTLLVNPQQLPGPQIVAHIREVVQVDAVVLFDAASGSVDAAGATSSEFELLARETYMRERKADHPDTMTWQRLLRQGPNTIGAIVMRGISLTPLLADSIASLAAIALERTRAFEKQSHAQAARHSEQLRTAVLDALAHAFKTPLTAIRTASSGLLEAGHLDPAQEDLVTLIDEESDKLNVLSTRLLQTARLEAFDANLHQEPILIPHLIHEVLTRHADQLAGHPTQVSITNEDCTAFGDRELLSTAILQFVDNAAKYSTPGSPIEIAVDERDAEIVISVHNEGSDVRPEERERIFERFYRSPLSNHRAPGTGLGLSISREAAEAHRGRVWVNSGPGKGTTFFLSLPHTERTVV